MAAESKATMKDVAAEAGVALGTVSKVINGIPVGEEYRLKVEAAIEKLHYQINAYAKGLKTNKTYCIALIIPNTKNPYFGLLTNAIHRAAVKCGYRLLLCCSDYKPELEQDFIQMAQQNRVDGIIGLTYNPRLAIPEHLPFIAIDRHFSTDVPCVSADNFGGGRLAAETLVRLGCKKLAFFRIGSSLNNEPNRRKDGFEAACQQLGASYEMKILEDNEPFSLFEEFLRQHCENGRLTIDGIFCVTDTLACSTVKMLVAMGLRVPEDVQVIGFDGVQWFGDMGYFCSTIVQPVDGIAETCMELLLEKDTANRPTQVCLPVTYAWGGTTKSAEKVQP